MGKEDSAFSSATTDTSSVTAIKVKVVLDTTTEELKNQFKGVQNSFKKSPVEIAFGVNEGATIGNVNAALKRIIKKVESPKLTLKIDESNIDAAVNKAVRKAQNGAGKASGASVKIKVDTKEATQKLKVFYDRVKEIGEVRGQLQDKLNQVRSAKPDDTLSKELGNTYRYLQLLRNEAAELRKELGSAIPTGKYSKLSEISRNSPNRDKIDYGSTENLKATVMQKFYSGKAKQQSVAEAQEISNTNEKLKEFYDLVEKVNTLNNKATMLPEGSVRELEEYNRQLDETGTRMTELMNELSGNIEIGEFSKLDTIMNELNNRSALFAARLADIQAKSGQKEFYSLVKEIGELNNKLSTADPSKQGSQIEVWQRRLAEAETELTNLMNTLREYVSIGEGSELDKLQQKLQFQSDSSFAKQLDNSRIAIQNFIKEYAALNIKLNSVDSINPDNQELVNLRNSLPEIERRVQNLSLGLRQAIETGDLSGLYLQFNTLRTAIDATNVSFANLSSESKLAGKELDNRLHLDNLIRELQKYKDSLTSAFNGSEYEQEYERILAMLKDSSTYFKAGEQAVENFKNACYKAGLETETLGQKLSRLFKEHFQTAIAMAGVAMVKQGLREVYNNVVDIDDAMVELKKVTTESTEAYSQFSDRAAKISRDLGASISDYVSATADWARLGYGLPDAEELARVSTLFANVGDGIENIADASSYMISILKGFDLAADDAQKVADLINEVANNEPASASDISEILTRSGAALHEAGNDLSQAISLGVAMNSVTQNAESTGQTLKTVSMYLRAAKTDLENMGESSDGCANSVSELRSELKQLTGVDIMKDAAGTQFKSTYDILKEISEVWGSLSDVTRANVTEMLGGKRNANAVAAVLSQFEIAEKSMKDAANSAGSAAKENEVYLSSITGKLAQLDSAFQQLSQDLLDSSLIKFFVDFATGAVDLADGAVKAAGALPTLTAAISGVLSVMQMSGKLKNGAGKVNMPSYICCV